MVVRAVVGDGDVTGLVGVTVTVTVGVAGEECGAAGLQPAGKTTDNARMETIVTKVWFIISIITVNPNVGHGAITTLSTDTLVGVTF
ncbi:MAG: hypothetical protein ABR958_07295 [Dehalococcoidales bacterium]